MLKIPHANINCPNPYTTCISSVAGKTANTASYVTRMNAAAPLVATHWADYDNKVINKQLTTLNPCNTGNGAQLIISNVCKDDLVDLYEKHMVQGCKAARDVYDKIKLSAVTCPLCGVGNVSSVDHYLPKSRYPVHSVNPHNLIPACEACQKSKLADVFSNQRDLPLYPYKDTAHFYNTDWIFCTITTKNGVLVFDFKADPPTNWPKEDRLRALNHFEAFNLKHAYAQDAWKEAVDIVTTIKFHIGREGKRASQAIKEYYLARASAHPFNSRKRATALAIVANKKLRNGQF